MNRAPNAVDGIRGAKHRYAFFYIRRGNVSLTEGAVN